MSKETKKKLNFLAGGSVACALALLLLLTGFRSPSPDREIRLIAKEMAYYLEGDVTANPVLTFYRGERVRLHLVNQDAGLVHDLVFPQWGLATEKLSYGESARLEFNPKMEGEQDYLCSLHPTMMRGRVAIVAASEARSIVSSK